MVYLQALVPKVFGWINKMYGLSRHLIICGIRIVPTQSADRETARLLKTRNMRHDCITNMFTLTSTVVLF